MFDRAALALVALALAVMAAACDEDGKTAPERCADPPLPLFDIQKTPPPEDDNRRFNDVAAGDGPALRPCITEVGHAVSSFSDGSAGETSSGGTSSSGGSSSGGIGAGGLAGTPGSSDAGAGGA